MTVSSSNRRPSIDVFALAGVIGVAVGLLDTAILQYFAATTGPERAIPLTYWISVPLIWVTCCLAVALLFSWSFLRRFAVPAVTFVAVGGLLLSRVAPLFYRAYGLSVKTVGVASLLATAIATVICSAAAARRFHLVTTHGSAVRKWLITTALVISCVCVLIPKTPRAFTPATDSPRTNIVLVFLDTTREDDSRTAMPALNRFASGAVVFDNAWAPAPWTLPSHISVLTGIDAWEPGGAMTAVPTGVPTLAQRLSSSGYATAAIFANPILRPESGLTRGYRNLSFSNSSGVALSGIGFLLSRSHFYGGPRIPPFAWMDAREVTSKAVQFIERARRPYFVTLNYIDAHSPYYVPRSCRDAAYQPHSSEDLRIFRRGVTSKINLPRPVADKLHDEYRAALRCMDRSISVLVSAISKQHDADRTVIAFVGDHGEQFGEHGLTLHGNSIYCPVLRVPLIMRVPGVKPRHIADPVSITDLNRALVQVAFNGASSQSQWPLLNPKLRRPAIAEFNMGTQHAAGIADANYHLLRWDNGREEWYAYSMDDYETQVLPVPQTPAAETLRERLLTQMAQRRSNVHSFRALGYIQ